MWASLKAHDAGQCIYVPTCRPSLEQLPNPTGVLAVKVLKARRNPGHAQIIPARAVIRKRQAWIQPLTCWIELYNKRFTEKWPTTHFWAPARNPKTCVYEIHGFFTPLFPEICKSQTLKNLAQKQRKTGLISDHTFWAFNHTLFLSDP